MGRSSENIHVLPPAAFDQGCTFETAPQKVADKVRSLEQQLLNVCSVFNVSRLEENFQSCVDVSHLRKGSLPKDTFSTLYDATGLLFLQWSASRQEKDRATEFASAKLINRFTKYARELDRTYGFVDQDHITRLHEAVKADMQESHEHYDPRRLAASVEQAAREHTGEKAWMGLALPTFSKQHYGRVLLDVVHNDESSAKSFITQSSFTDNEVTLFHTHGQNWAFSRPLGQDGANRHHNILLQPKYDEDVFPLTLLERSDYDASGVAVMPAKTIHGVKGKREELPKFLLKNIYSSKHARDKIDEAKEAMANYSALHLYKPDGNVVKDFADNVTAIGDLFEANDMIVFDQEKKVIWAGGGGAWQKRLMDYGPTGEHCGVCFIEDDPRREDLDPTVVSERFIQRPSPNVIFYRGNELL